MSLILDALRKSEAERRRGQSPNLHGASILAPAPRREGVRQWPILAGGLLVLLAIAVLLWPRAQPEVTSADVTSADVASADATSADVRPTAGDGQRDAVARGDAAAAGAAIPLPAPSRPVAPGRPSARDARGVPRAAPLAPATVPPARAPLHPSMPASVPTHTSVAPTSAAVPTPGAQPSRAPPIAIAPSAPASPTPTASGDDLPSLAALAPAERAALPPLKLSVHVWNSDPKQRFAIVDGQRIVEGATIGGAVVDAIRRDGVVLEVNGRRVLLPKP
jgi:general secretion pathway protein B